MSEESKASDLPLLDVASCGRSFTRGAGSQQLGTGKEPWTDGEPMGNESVQHVSTGCEAGNRGVC